MVKKTIVFICLISIFSVALYAFTTRVRADFDCLTVKTTSSPADKAYCKQQLVQIEAQLADLLAKQKAQQAQTGTLIGDVNYLTSQINALQTKVKARSLAIAQLTVDINTKISTIETLSQKIESEHESLAQLIRNTDEFDNETLVNLVLSDQTLSGFYNDLASYNSIKQAIKDSVDTITGVKTQTEAQKEDLLKQQNAETDAKAELESAKQKVAVSQAQKQQLLVVSQQSEAAYAALAAQKKAQADKIRAALFSLAGISQKIDFGTALNYAIAVNKSTGVDPAFLLAILTQESDLGANVGQCYLSDPTTGAGVGKNTGTPFWNVMSPSRDVPPFIVITKALGIDPYQTPVSCPIAGVVGYGGAMGPAQFIPSTWQLFQARLQSILGYFPSPWAPQDSFLASGLYLTDLGAIGPSQSAQNAAACRYYGSGGTSCYYALSVAKLKASIQANIDVLQGQ